MPREQRTPLSRLRIAEAALQLICTDGLPSLSMRKVGAALGVEAMSLYRHVTHRDDLLDAVHALILDEVERPPPSDDWVEDAMQMARSLRDVLLRRPNAVAVVATRPAIAGASVDLLEDAVARVHPHADDPIAVVQTLFAFVVGHCTFHAALVVGGGGLALDPVRHPQLSRALTTGARLDARAEFEVGLAALGAGLRATRG